MKDHGLGNAEINNTCPAQVVLLGESALYSRYSLYIGTLGYTR